MTLFSLDAWFPCRFPKRQSFTSVGDRIGRDCMNWFLHFAAVLWVLSYVVESSFIHLWIRSLPLFAAIFCLIIQGKFPQCVLGIDFQANFSLFLQTDLVHNTQYKSSFDYKGMFVCIKWSCRGWSQMGKVQGLNSLLDLIVRGFNVRKTLSLERFSGMVMSFHNQMSERNRKKWGMFRIHG